MSDPKNNTHLAASPNPADKCRSQLAALTRSRQLGWE